MQKAHTIVVCLALLVAFARAPFLHVHRGDYGAEGHTSEQAHIHIHRAANHPAQPTFDRIDPAGDEQPISWFQADQRCGLIVFEAPQFMEVAPPLFASECIESPSPTSFHDTLCGGEIPVRAPPIFFA